MRKASAVLKTDPILLKLLMLSNTTTNGSLSDFLNSSTLILPNSEVFNFLMFTTLMVGKNKDCVTKPNKEGAFSLFYIFVACKL